jgi:glycine cleavage system H protein
MPAFAAAMSNDAQPSPDCAPKAEVPKTSAGFHHYQRGRFSARLPLDYLYTPSHAWLRPTPEENPTRYRVGLTKFATRMLGELVDIQLDPQPGDPISPGDILGSIEGFKALTDLYCVGQGIFVSANPELAKTVEFVSQNPHTQGWLYAFDGAPGEGALDVKGYCGLLDETIDRILANEKQAEDEA